MIDTILDEDSSESDNMKNETEEGKESTHQTPIL